MSNPAMRHTRPRSPNVQIYRPQLTSVLSIANRITGVILSVYAVMLVMWLVAVAAGPPAYATVMSSFARGSGKSYYWRARFLSSSTSVAACDIWPGMPSTALASARYTLLVGWY